MGILIWLYLVSALYVLAENVSPQRARRDPRAVARAVGEAVIWPLALLPWREWPQQISRYWAEITPRYSVLP